MIKEVLLASKLYGEGHVIIDIVDHSDIGSNLGVYQRDEGEETINIKQTKHHKA